MTFLEQLQSHRGGLIRLKELYWYTGRGWDGSPGRICLVLDVGSILGVGPDADTYAAATSTTPVIGGGVVLLLIDGCPHWVRVVHEDVELL